MELHSSNFILHGHQTVIGKLVIGEVVVRKVGSGRRGLGVEVSPACKRSLQWSCTEAASPQAPGCGGTVTAVCKSKWKLFRIFNFVALALIHILNDELQSQTLKSSLRHVVTRHNSSRGNVHIVRSKDGLNPAK